jgi:hypothetical protein
MLAVAVAELTTVELVEQVVLVVAVMAGLEPLLERQHLQQTEVVEVEQAVVIRLLAVETAAQVL